MFNTGQKIGSYTLEKKLGEGGFGEVWLAENHNNPSSEKVAIKLPRKEQIDLQAVKEEIFNWTLSGKHKNILPIIECETFGNQIAIVSEFAPDGSLQNLLENHGAFSIIDAVEIMVGISDGLAHLHKRKIIHRDLKPDNILFQGRTPRLTDFGISRALPVGSKSLTVSRTLPYMAPEAFDGKRNEQTDISSIGVILYQLVSGNLPFPQRDQTELIGALVMKEPDDLPDSVPTELKTIIAKCLEKEPENRYQTADQMREDLSNLKLNALKPESKLEWSGKPLASLKICSKCELVYDNPKFKVCPEDGTSLLPLNEKKPQRVQNEISEKKTDVKDVKAEGDSPKFRLTNIWNKKTIIRGLLIGTAFGGVFAVAILSILIAPDDAPPGNWERVKQAIQLVALISFVSGILLGITIVPLLMYSKIWTAKRIVRGLLTGLVVAVLFDGYIIIEYLLYSSKGASAAVIVYSVFFSLLGIVIIPPIIAMITFAFTSNE